MIRAVLVDDEQLALERLERMLLRQEGIEVVGTFTSSRKAIECISDLSPDVAFLDIEMPGLNGLEAAEQILSVNQNVDVVFVTAFDKYAVEAFELNALDYLLKPVSEETLLKIVHRITARHGLEMEMEEPVESRRVLCLGEFAVTRSEYEPLALNWRTAKSRELFAYLVQHREKPVEKGSIIQALWPGLPHKRADSIFYATIYYLRKILQDDLRMCMLRNTEEQHYLLEMKGVYCDADYFQQMAMAGHVSTADGVASLEKAVYAYRRDYLEQDHFDWAAGERKRLLLLYLDALKQLANHWLKLRNYSSAEVFLRKWVAKLPLAEEPRCLMMEMYVLTGRYENLIRGYDNYRSLLMEQLGREPGQSMKSLFYKLLNNVLD